MKWPKLVLALLVLAVAGAAGTARAGDGSVSLTVYSGQHPGTIDALVKAFEAATGIHVSVISSTDATLATQVVVQGSHSPADVFVAENAPALEDLGERGLLAPLSPGVLDAVPPRDRSARGDWVGIAAHASLLVYNTRDVKPAQLPASILGLADPQWRGKLALAPNETDFQPIVAAVAARYGEAKTVAWLKGLGDNARGNVDSNNTAIVSQVNDGAADIAVIDPFYWYALRDELGSSRTHTAIHLFAPADPGYIVDVSGAAILRSSSQLAAAKEFVSFLTSKKGQQALVRGTTYEYPLVSGVPSPPPLYPWSKLRPDPITAAQIGDGRQAFSLLQQAGLL
jgi:iron(III) transport system substrate-binding protein